jgi:isopenicillin-N N-acyltransferase-like protein
LTIRTNRRFTENPLIAQHAFPLVEVSGTSYELGYQHGAQAVGLIQRYLLLIERVTGLSRDVLCRNALVFLPLIERLSPAYLDEVRGLAAGAGLSFEEALLCQARAEAAYPPQGGCSTFALTGEATANHETLAGQNQDLPPEYADVAILLHAKPTDGRPRMLMFTFAGQLGYVGMNHTGMCLFANALYDYTWQLGLPKYPMKRLLLEQTTVADGVRLLERHRLCSANNLVMADGHGQLADVEVRPEGIAVFPDDHPHRRVHTNHYVTPEFQSIETNSLPDSCPRLDRMRALIAENWGGITVDTMKRILSDHAGDPGGICRHGVEGWHTISGYIAEPAQGRLHVRRGHGCLGTWQSYVV